MTVSKWEWTVTGTNKMDNTVIGRRNMGPTCDNCESCVYVSVHAYTHIFHASHTLHYTHTSHTHTHTHYFTQFGYKTHALSLTHSFLPHAPVAQLASLMLCKLLQNKRSSTFLAVCSGGLLYSVFLAIGRTCGHF